MARNGHSIDLNQSSSATKFRVPSSDTVTRVAESSIKSPLTRQMTAGELKPATTTEERYCAFIEWLMEEIEANDHGIGHDMRCRIKDDIIRIHKLEARLLEAACGHRDLKDLMGGKIWRLAEMDDEHEAARDPSTIVHGGTDNMPAVFQQHNLAPSISLENLGLHSCGAANPLPNPTASRMQTGGSNSSSRRQNIAIDRFLEERDDPWHLESLASECSQCDNTKISEDGSWLPFQGFGTSTVASKRCHELVPVPSFQDLPAFTDSSDTETFVSARSVVDEHAFGSHSLFLMESEMNGSLLVIDDQRYGDIMEQDGWASKVADMYKEQLAARINVI